MADKTFDMAWVSEIDSVSGTLCVQTRDEKFYKDKSKTQARRDVVGRTVLIEITDGELVKVFDTDFLQLPGEVICAHFAWRQPDQLDQQGMFLYKASYMEDPVLKGFLIDVLSDAKIMQPFYQARASQNFHHNEKGELFKHSVQVAMTAADLAINHGLGQREVECAFVCGFLHDTGKLLMFYNTDENQQKGVNGRHEDFNFMVLAKHLEALKAKDKVLFEAVSATLTAAPTRRKNNEYIVETIVRAADCVSAATYEHRAAFKGKPASQQRVGAKSGRRYKRLGAAQLAIP